MSDIEFAKALDRELRGKKVVRKPRVIASDFFGVSGKNLKFEPAFHTDKKPELECVDFSFMNADAEQLPAKKESVDDILFDRKGALWHLVYNWIGKEIGKVRELRRERRSAAVVSVKKFLAQAREILKKNGKIIFDAPQRDTGKNALSTEYILSFIFKDFKKEFGKLGFDASFVGPRNDRLFVLTKILKPAQSTET